MLTRKAPRGFAVPGDVDDRKLVVHRFASTSRALAALYLPRGGFGMEQRRKLRYERLSGRGCRGAAFDDFAICNGFTVEGLVAGIVCFQRRAVEAEAREGSFGVAEEENLDIGITVGGLSISPGSRSIRTDCEPLGKQFRAPLLVQRQDHDVDLLAADLHAQTAGLHRDRAG